MKKNYSRNSRFIFSAHILMAFWAFTCFFCSKANSQSIGKVVYIDLLDQEKTISPYNYPLNFYPDIVITTDMIDSVGRFLVTVKFKDIYTEKIYYSSKEEIVRKTIKVLDENGDPLEDYVFDLYHPSKDSSIIYEHKSNNTFVKYYKRSDKTNDKLNRQDYSIQNSSESPMLYCIDRSTYLLENELDDTLSNKISYSAYSLNKQSEFMSSDHYYYEQCLSTKYYHIKDTVQSSIFHAFDKNGYLSKGHLRQVNYLCDSIVDNYKQVMFNISLNINNEEFEDQREKITDIMAFLNSDKAKFVAIASNSTSNGHFVKNILKRFNIRDKIKGVIGPCSYGVEGIVTVVVYIPYRYVRVL